MISADDLWHDHVNGQLTMHFRGVEKKYSLNDNQVSWLRKFMEIWYRAEEHELDKRKTDEEKIEDLWHVFFDTDKRSFNEYFSEEYGFTCNEDITYKQMVILCQKLLNTENKPWR